VLKASTKTLIGWGFDFFLFAKSLFVKKDGGPGWPYGQNKAGSLATKIVDFSIGG
jgi:hypothetical protein